MTTERAGIGRWAQCVAVACISCLVGCTFLSAQSGLPPSPRDAMRSLVHEIEDYATARSPGFLVVAQNGEELLTTGNSADAPISMSYADAVDGFAREDLFYGYEADNEPTPADATRWMLGYLDRAEALGIAVFVIDYCWDRVCVDAAGAECASHGFVSYAAPSRLLDVIPTYPASPNGVNADDVQSLSDVRNFLVLIDPWRYDSKESFLAALATTNYDALVVDADYGGVRLTPADVQALRTKADGGARLVLCYLSIGEAESYRDYWNANWLDTPPDWLLSENPDWPGNYPVKYWDSQWRGIVFDSLDAVLSAGFDGVYLDRVDVYERFETG
jgi:cysteinyl-tRNA synthetase, unknown class